MPSAPSGGLTPEAIRNALAEFIELAVEYERLSADLDGVDTDAEIFDELFNLEGTRAALERVVSTLRDQRKRRATMIKNARIAHFLNGLRKKVPATAQLPPGTDATVRELGHRCGLDLTDDDVAQVLDGLRRQSGAADGRDYRIFRSLGGDGLRERSLKHWLDLLDDKIKMAPGKVKYAEQLEVYRYDGVGASAAVHFVLEVLGEGLSEPAAGATKAWDEAIRGRLHAALERVGSAE